MIVILSSEIYVQTFLILILNYFALNFTFHINIDLFIPWLQKKLYTVRI